MNAKSYEQVYAETMQYAERIAKNLNLKVKEEKKNTFWGDYDKPIITWSKKDKSSRVEVRTRFGNPVISLYNGEDFACVEIGRGSRATGRKTQSGYDEHEYDSVYRPKEIQAWGVMGLSIATEMWNELSKIIHKPANGYIEE